MVSQRKFNFGGATLNTREPEVASAEPKAENRAQELVNAIEKSEVNTAFNMKFIPRNKLVFHKENFYPMEEIEKLAESILDIGLLHNLDVSYDENKDLYVIDAGERRTRAIDMLLERFENYEDKESEDYKKYLYNVDPFRKGYPAKVSTGYSKLQIRDDMEEEVAKELDDIATQLRLRVSNELGREYDPVRTKKAMDDIVKLKQRRNEILGNNKKITNKEIAEELNISDRMVQKYKAIDKLIPELQEVFREHGITLTDGANYANLNEDEQRQILELYKAGGNKKEVETLYNQLNMVRNEIKQKDKQLQELEQEKDAANERAERAKADAETLKEQIREELQKELTAGNEADRKKISDLELQLEKANQNVEKYDAQKRELTAQANQIEQLKKELASKKATKNPVDNPEVWRAALGVDTCLKGVENALQSLENAMKEYEASYDGAEVFSSPEVYKASVLSILNEFENKINK